MTKKSKQNPNIKLNALLEIGLEEVPARFMPAMLADLKEKAAKELETSRLTFRSVKTLGTPRRLVLFIEGLPPKQKDLSREVRGPQKAAAFDVSGKPTKAGEGFAAGQGVKVSDLTVKKVGDKEFVFASVTEKGIDTVKLFEQFFPRLIKSLYMPISMRWGEGEQKFIRPIHWLFAACGDSIVDFDFAGVRASNNTRGHGYFAPKPVKIDISKGVDLDGFKRALFKSSVILDQDERKKKIAAHVSAEAKKLKGEALLDDDLLDEVTFLVEWPVIVSGSLKKEFLGLPKDVLVTSMKKNQKYFAVVDVSEQLMPCFINVTNGVDAKDVQKVREGNEKVLAARLNDARFFFEEDRKKFLGDLTTGLAKVAFVEKLGSMMEKVERIASLSSWISHELKLPASKQESIAKISGLCKSDLLTHMVYEFPSLQGIMGREYGLLEGMPKEVARGIAEHYLPRFAGDKLPASTEGAVVAIADKIDSIVGCFSIDLKPSGSEDPFALRRQAHGIVSILMDKKLNLPLDVLVDRSYKLYEPLFLGEIFASGKVKFSPADKVIPAVLSFLSARLKGILLDESVRYDVADAALEGFEDVLDTVERATSVSAALKEDWFKGVVFTADRVKRLAVNATRENVLEHDFTTDEEKNIHALYLDVNKAVVEAAEKSDYAASLKALARMTQPVEEFFEKVMVMDKDERLKANRLALLKTLERMFLEVADFSKIVI